MRFLIVILIAVSLVVPCSIARAQDVGALVAQIQSRDEAQRMAAVDAIAQAGAAALAPLFGLLEGENHDADICARQTIQKIVYRASAPGAAERGAVAAALAEVAASPGRLGVRRYALQMVSFVGRDEVVPTLARLLGDPEMREMARWALVRIPGDTATSALAGAVASAAGEVKVGLINALGARAAASALPVLRTALNDKDESVCIAAAYALARIPEPASARMLMEAIFSASGRGRAAAADAYLRLADTLLAAGNAGRAAAMYKWTYCCAGAGDEQHRCAALAGLARARGAQAIPLLLEALRGGQPALAGVAAASLAAIPGRDATREIVGALPSARPELRLRLISILGERRDIAALPALIASCEPKRPVAERAAATTALGEIGSAAAVPTLVGALGSLDEPVKAAAIEALARMPGKSATKTIASVVATGSAGSLSLPAAGMSAQVALVQVLGYRRDRQATPALTAAMRARSPAVRLAAIEAAGRLDDPAAVPELLRVLSDGTAEEQHAAAIALGQMRTKEARQAMVAVLDGATPIMKERLLMGLGIRPDPELLPVFVSAADDSDDSVAKEALVALARLSDDRAAPVFIQAFRTRSPELALIAAGGYLMLSSDVLNSDPAAATAMARRALEGLRGDDRRLPLQAIARLRDAGSLPLVLPLLGSESLGGDAARAAIAIADSLAAADKDRAVSLYREVLARGRDSALMREAVRGLRDLGVKADPAAEAGFVTRWWVIGPFRDVKRLMKEDVVATGEPIDVSQRVSVGDKKFRWRRARVDDPLGMLDIEQAVAEMEDCGAYMYAEVTSDADRDVLLKIGSDDDVVCWLNGKQVHAFFGGRGYNPDQDVVRAALRAGSNTILLKVLNRGGDWAAGLRITDPSGQPLLLKQPAAVNRK
jgi:HEAT repeat protein